MKNAVFTGSFDPITIGHYDIINRIAIIFDKVYIAVTTNSEKNYMFDGNQRYEMVKKACVNLANVEVIDYNGLIAELAKNKQAIIVKGVRNSVDFAYEYEMANINREISSVDTFLLPAKPEFSYISSTFVREMIKYGNNPEKYIGRGKDKEDGK